MIPGLSSRRGKAFTLLELLVALGVLSVLVVLIFQLTDQLSRVWSMSQAKIEVFRDARAAYSTLTQRLRQATLNPHWDYDDPNAPRKYQRKSNLHFVSGPAGNLLPPGKYSGHAVFFTAPLGKTAEKPELGRLSNMLNGCGIFVEYAQEAELPDFLAGSGDRKWRYRLRHFVEPSEKSVVQEAAPGGGWTASNSVGWFRNYFTTGDPPVHDLAENIILLLVLPLLPAREDAGACLAPGFSYNSRLAEDFTTNPPSNGAPAYTGNTLHQLPPLLRIVMVAIDEKSASRLDPGNSSQPPDLVPAGLFQDPARLDDDLNELSEALDRHPQKIAYRIFDSTIALRGAKWSRD